MKSPSSSHPMLAATLGCALAAVVCGVAPTRAQQPSGPVVSSEQFIDTLGKPNPTPDGKTREWNPGGTNARSISVEQKVQVSTRSVLFKFGTAELEGTQSYDQIREMGKALGDSRLKGVVCEVQGHTDNVGGDAYNKKLSEDRAKHIVELLVTLYRVPSENLRAVGMGKSKPVEGTVETQTDEQRAMNRRVVVQRVN